MNPQTPEQKTLKPEKRDTSSSFEKLSSIIAKTAEDINKEVASRYGLERLVDSSLQIDIANFSRKKGGIYKKEDIDEDKKKVEALDREHSGADDEKIQKYYKETHSLPSEIGTEELKKEVVRVFRNQKEKSKGSQAEMVITALLHKVLKNRFLVVRSSTFDDYMHGIDNFILDKETGAVICAFDEVIEHEGDRERGESGKVEKIRKLAKKGGTEAKYGIKLENGKLVRSPVAEVPVFYLALDGKDLHTLTNDLFYGTGTLSDTERKLFTHLVASIQSQKKDLETLALPEGIRAKLAEFGESLSVLEGFTKKG